MTYKLAEYQSLVFVFQQFMQNFAKHGQFAAGQNNFFVDKHTIATGPA